MFKKLGFVVVAVLALSFQSVLGQAKNETVGAQSLTGELVVKASPADVWNVLTDAKQLAALLGYEYQGGTSRFDRVGAVARVKVWGEGGNFVAVRSVPGEQLRLSLDPVSGSYICSCSWTVSKADGGASIRYVERYTESGKQTKEALQSQVDDLNARLAKLQRLVEKD